MAGKAKRKYHSSVIGPFVAAMATDIEGVCWTGKRAHALADMLPL